VNAKKILEKLALSQRIHLFVTPLASEAI